MTRVHVAVMYATQPCSPMCSYYRMCFLATECVLLLQNVCSYYRMCALTTECVLLLQIVCSYYRMCAFTTECVLLLQNVCFYYRMTRVHVAAMDATQPCLPMCTMSHHHTYYVTSSFILCHIIHTMSQRWTQHSRAYLCALPARVSLFLVSLKYVTSSFILCQIIHTMSQRCFALSGKS